MSESESDVQTEKEVCYACEDPIEDGEWIIPLETFEAYYLGGELTLNQDHTVETTIHAECLKHD